MKKFSYSRKNEMQVQSSDELFKKQCNQLFVKVHDCLELEKNGWLRLFELFSFLALNPNCLCTNGMTSFLHVDKMNSPNIDRRASHSPSCGTRGHTSTNPKSPEVLLKLYGLYVFCPFFQPERAIQDVKNSCRM